MSVMSEEMLVHPEEEQATYFGAVGTIRWVIDQAGVYRKRLLGGYALRVVDAIVAGVPIGVLILLLDQLGKGAPSTRQIVIWSSIIFGAYLLRWAIYYTATRLSEGASYLMLGDVRIRLLDHLATLPMGFFARRNTGDLATTVTQDFKMLELLPERAVPASINAVVLPIVISIFTFFVDWRLALVLLITLPLSFYLNMRFQMVFQSLALKRQNIQAEATNRIIEFVQGIPVIRAYRQTGRGLARYEQAIEDFRRNDTNLVTRLVGIMGAFSTVLELGIVLVLAVGTYFFFGGEISAITFLIFLVVSLRFYGPLHELTVVAEITRIGEASLSRVDAVMTTPALPAPETAAAIVDYGIEFDDVTFAYEREGALDEPVLRDISFVAPPRSLTALVGPSGSGKTTIANLVARFWDPQEGSVRIGGVDIRDMPASQLNSLISYVFQDVYLFQDTILENIRFGRPEASFDDVVDAAMKARAHDFIMALPDGYDTQVGERGSTLSGGERQRISIARAILKDAPIVLLDEATASVDPTNESLIQGALNALVADKTLIVIAHRLSTVREASQILVLQNGAIAEHGAHDDLLARDGLYARFWRERSRAREWRLRGRGMTAAEPVSP